jgi:hypothetical protein
MPNWKRNKELKGRELENYRMLSGIYGVCEDFGYKLTPIQVKLLCRLYESITIMNIVWLIENAEEKRKASNEVDYKAGKKQLIKFVSYVASKYLKEDIENNISNREKEIKDGNE